MLDTNICTQPTYTKIPEAPPYRIVRKGDAMKVEVVDTIEWRLVEAKPVFGCVRRITL